MNDNQKGTGLSGAALSDEAMASSDSILAPGAYGVGQKGLQQFYSPPQAARLAKSVMGDYVAVLDPTAGDGSLLSEFSPANAFGVELDKDQITASEGRYNAIRGDFQHVYTLLRTGMPGWDAIVANPPFGLQWSDPTIRDGKDTNSTVLTMMMVNRLLADDGQFMFIAAKNRHDRQLTKLADYSTVYCVIECDDLFEGTREPCVVLFGINDSMRSPARPGVIDSRAVTVDMLDLCGDWVKECREKALDSYSTVSTRSYAYHKVEEFKAIQIEYDRRVEKRIKTREFDAQLYNGDHVQWLPSGFAKLALNNAGLAYDFQGLNQQPVAYFAQNERLWFKLGNAEERGLITIDPKLRLAVAAVLGDIQKHRVPLYAVKPQQRLGFLDDIDSLVCKLDDPERRFKRGMIYTLDTDTVTKVESGERMVESKKTGEWTMKQFKTHRKVMRITLAGNGAHYVVEDGGDNATQDISWLIRHFEIPDPGEIATRHPEEIAALEALVTEVLTEFQTNSAKWEETHSVSKPFSVRDFQVQDIARMIFKGFGILAWEQGLGKTVGALAFYKAATKRGAKEKLLITTPGDLKDQWTRECERFLDITPEVIGAPGRKTFQWEPNEKGQLVKKHITASGHGQAKRIAKELKQGGTGVFIVHYEAMSVNGTRRGKKLPVVTVREWEEQRVVKGTDKYGHWIYYRESDEQEVAPREPAALAAALGITAPADDYGRIEGVTHEAMIEAGFKQLPVPNYITEKGTHARNSYINPVWETVTKKLTSKDLCPECEADTRNGWNGTFCASEKPDGSKCGYAHFAVKMKPVASLLTTAFHDGVVVLDEITYIQSGTSKRTMAMTGVQGRFRLGLSGTPIKNYVNQIFWPMAWVMGYDKPWFPYGHDGGEVRFENDFCVVELQMKGRRQEARKVLPDVTNLSRFWRMLASHNIRRRQEETGEDIVDIYYHEIKVPLGVSQAEQTKEWLKKLPHGFPAFFAEKYPDHNVVAAGMHEIMAAMLGLNWKLDYATTIPQGDEDHEWPGIAGISNYTPANLRALELMLALAKQGRKVLFGSHLVATGEWMANRLIEKGVKAVHIVDNDGTTIDAKARSERVYTFQTDEDTQVFCAGMKAIRLGHNLDAADAVVINGLDFDYETLDQFVKRVRRLTSTNDVDVFVMLPTLDGQETITTRKWQLLGMKGNAADLALDGRLVVKMEQEISESEMIRELQERGLTVTEDAIPEEEIERAWEAIPQVADFEGTIPDRPEKADGDGEPLPVEEDSEELILTADDIEAEEEEDGDVPESDFDAIDAAEAELNEPVYIESGDDTYLGSEEEKAEEEELVADATSSSDLPPSDTGALFDEEPEPESSGDSAVEPEPEEVGQLALDVATPAPLDVMGQIKQAAELHDLGILTDDEFAEAKADLLAALKAERMVAA